MNRRNYNSKYEDDISSSDRIKADQKRFEDEDHKGLWAAYNQPTYSHHAYGSGKKGAVDRGECESCHGTGWDSGAGLDGLPCENCRGSGYTRELRASKGFHGYVNHPMQFLAGESGRERVNIHRTRKKHHNGVLHHELSDVSKYFGGRF